MNFEEQYSRYYDLLYQDKNYVAEAQFLQSLLGQYSSDYEKILDLGCGTGKHAAQLVRQGLEVLGLDLSFEMLKSAEKLREGLSIEHQNRLSFQQGDIRTFRLKQKFDAVLSLFHVMSYQVKNEDIFLSLETVKEHLKAGGLFIFDVWYGPAVLFQSPSIRVKRLSDGFIQVIRIAEPEHFPKENRVNVNYEIFFKQQDEDSFKLIRECHAMRYFFEKELEVLLSSQGFKVLASFEWLTRKIPSQDTWGVCFVCRLT